MAKYQWNLPSNAAGKRPRSDYGMSNLVEGQREPDILLPPNASRTLFVDGFPSDCTNRELAHIFRPFRGYKTLRIVRRPSQLHRDVEITMCFVDFASPSYAAVAMAELQGYKLDEHDDESPRLKLQFCRQPLERSRMMRHMNH